MKRTVSGDDEEKISSCCCCNLKCSSVPACVYYVYTVANRLAADIVIVYFFSSQSLKLEI